MRRRAVVREPFRQRRCVVPVSGYYEWRKQAQPGLSKTAAAPPVRWLVRWKAVSNPTLFGLAEARCFSPAFGTGGGGAARRSTASPWSPPRRAINWRSCTPGSRCRFLPKTRGFGCAPNGTARSWRGCSRHACRWSCLRRRCRATSATRATKAAAARRPLARRRSSPPTRDAPVAQPATGAALIRVAAGRVGHRGPRALSANPPPSSTNGARAR